MIQPNTFTQNTQVQDYHAGWEKAQQQLREYEKTNPKNQAVKARKLKLAYRLRCWFYFWFFILQQMPRALPKPSGAG
jgi:hypothetical protein